MINNFKLKTKHKALLKKRGNAALGKIKQEWISFCKENPGVENISYHDYLKDLREEISQEENKTTVLVEQIKNQIRNLQPNLIENILEELEECEDVKDE